jgi:hypothetical protein
MKEIMSDEIKSSTSLQDGVITEFSLTVSEMENSVLEILKKLEKGYALRKWAISRDTGIPIDILTVILKRLKDSKKIELIMIFDDSTCKADGSGYCIAGGMLSV